MALSESLKQEVNRIVAGFQCICGNVKTEGQPFCFECYYTLPWKPHREKLHKASGDEYLFAFDEARDYLKFETDRIPK